MSDLICPYNATLAQKSNFSCPNADEVIRRGGAEYVCLQSDSYKICSEVHSKVKAAYLSSEGLEDDLLTVPHSTFVKIQFGCILGLSSTLGQDTSDVEDMGALITGAVKHYKNIDDFPFGVLNETIAAYKLQKRVRRK